MPVTRLQTVVMEEQMAQLLQMMKNINVNMEEQNRKMEGKIEGVLREQEKNRQEDLKEIKNGVEQCVLEVKDEMKKEIDVIKLEVGDVKNQIEQSALRVKNEIKNEVDKAKHEVDEVKQEINEMKKEVDVIKQKVENSVSEFKENVETKILEIEKKFDGRLLKEMKHLKVSGISEPSTSTNLRLKTPTFDGNVPWSTYRRQFEAAANINGWTLEEKATALMIALRGDTLNILQTIPANVEPSYDNLVSRLEMRYGDSHLQQVYHAQLKNRHQKYGETLQEFEADISRLVRMAYPNAPDSFLEQLAVESFTYGVDDVELQRDLRLGHAKTLNEALARALEFEAVKQASKSHHGRVRLLEEQQQNTEKLENLEDVIQRVVTKITNEREIKRQKWLRCWDCGELGHVRSRCPRTRAIRQEQEN